LNGCIEIAGADIMKKTFLFEVFNA